MVYWGMLRVLVEVLDEVGQVGGDGDDEGEMFSVIVSMLLRLQHKTHSCRHF
jgi:hypothetical protein